MRTPIPAIILLYSWLPCSMATAGDDAAVTIRVLPRKVYASIVYELRLEAPAVSGGTAGKYWSWSATGGELLSDGESSVHWRAPAAPGEVTIAVAELGREGRETDLCGRLQVPVHPPSTEDMVFVPAGTFTMGDLWTDTTDPSYTPASQDFFEKPPHVVHLEGYWIDRYKVTNRQYVAFLNDFIEQGLAWLTPRAVVGVYEGVDVPFYFFTIANQPGVTGGPTPMNRKALYREGDRVAVRKGAGEHPVMDVTWAGSVAYAFYHGKRLPSEAEWSKAARGTDGRRYPWGNELPTRYHANVNRFFGDNFEPVGSFSPLGDSPYGVADVLGGFEWVWDWFGDYYYWDNYSELPLHNPRGTEWGFDRTVRGVGVYYRFQGDEHNIKPLSFRYQWVFEFEHGHIFAHKDTGFRTALSPGPRGGKDPRRER